MNYLHWGKKGNAVFLFFVKKEKEGAFEAWKER